MSGAHRRLTDIDYGRMIRVLNAIHYAGEMSFYHSAPLRPCEDVLCRRIHRGSRVLDVGCGAGRVTVPLVRSGARGVGVDINPRSLRAARSGNRKLPLLNATMAALPLAAGTFDQVWCLRFSFNALPTEAERLNTIRELWRVCAPGGLVLIEAFNWHYPGRHGLLRLANVLDTISRHLRWYGQGRTGSVPMPARDILYLANKAPAVIPGYAHLTTVRELRGLIAAAGLAQSALVTDEAGLVSGDLAPVRNRHRNYATWVVLRKPDPSGPVGGPA